MTEKKNKGSLLIVSGPSGVGKDTIFEELENVWKSVSYATRAPRSNETDGVNYHFISKEKFKEILISGGMLEYTEYVDNYYGTPKKPVEEHLNNGIDVILVIEVEGMRQVKKIYPEAVSIFILPPSLKELESRIRGRNQEDDDKIRKRLEKAVGEIKSSAEYDYIVVNSDLNTAVTNLKSIISAAGCRAYLNKEFIEKINYEVNEYVISGNCSNG